MEASKFIDGIEIVIEKDQQIQEEPFSSNSEVDNKDENSKPSPTSNIPPTSATTLLNKIINTMTDPDSVKQLCNPCIESKHMKIVRYKKMTPTTRKLEKIYADLWRLYNPLLILGRSYIGLLLDKFTCKLWVLLFRSKNEFFDTFKLWLPCAEGCREKLGYL